MRCGIRAGDLLGMRRSLDDAGLYVAELDLMRHAKALADNHLNPDDYDTLLVRGAIAHCLGELGDPQGAIGAYGALLPGRRNRARVLGADQSWGSSGDSCGVRKPTLPCGKSLKT